MRYVFLLSGGMDSTAALLLGRTLETMALLIDYGQPNRDSELSAAEAVCEQLGVAYHLRLALADALPRGAGAGILGGVPDHDGLSEGLSPAYVPGRNMVFLSVAVAHATRLFQASTDPVALVLAVNAADALRFPDCRREALDKAQAAFSAMTGRDIAIITPFANQTKAEILRELNDAQREIVARSWSCYTNDGPCGRCGACAAREAAFAAVGLVDRATRCVPR